MLVLARRANESVIIGGNIEVEILEIRGRIVRLGIKAPREIPVVRRELCPLCVADWPEQDDAVLAQKVAGAEQSSITGETSERVLHSFVQRRRA